MAVFFCHSSKAPSVFPPKTSVLGVRAENEDLKKEIETKALVRVSGVLPKGLRQRMAPRFAGSTDASISWKTAYGKKETKEKAISRLGTQLNAYQKNRSIALRKRLEPGFKETPIKFSLTKQIETLKEENKILKAQLRQMQKLQSENDLFRQKFKDFARIAKDLKGDRDHYRSAYHRYRYSDIPETADDYERK